jgi:hypothetical protein
MAFLYDEREKNAAPFARTAAALRQQRFIRRQPLPSAVGNQREVVHE